MQPRHPVAPSRGGTLGGRARVCGELSVKSCAVRAFLCAGACTRMPRTHSRRAGACAGRLTVGVEGSDLPRGTFCGRLMPSWPRFGEGLRRTSGEGEIRTL